MNSTIPTHLTIEAKGVEQSTEQTNYTKDIKILQQRETVCVKKRNMNTTDSNAKKEYTEEK
ncbi:hypothetical protein X943_001162 [Babesia divergens]|uniref:Uncharacterized protein n=1 Tax=Babesia divergens TaxID=32595 RepID=A0AAD9GFC9_BABDI|nr:hypothetical protein X943_001162 [Babesia divergens]